MACGHFVDRRVRDPGDRRMCVTRREVGVVGSQDEGVDTRIAASSAAVNTLSALGRRKRSIARISEATVRAFSGRRADRRSASTSESGALFTSAEPRPWASRRRYVGRGLGKRRTATPRPRTVNSDSGIRTRTSGSATAGTPTAITSEIRSEPAAACHRETCRRANDRTTGTSSNPRMRRGRRRSAGARVRERHRAGSGRDPTTRALGGRARAVGSLEARRTTEPTPRP